MFLKRLLLRNFRNYKQAVAVFSPSINLIQGENGQGKTNLLEAIHLISTGRSFRTNSLSDLISFGEKFFYLEADFCKEGVFQSLKIYYDEKTRRVQYNTTVYSSLNSLLGILPFVLLTPDDLSLVSGPPIERRRFLDLHIAQMHPLYVHHLSRYFKAMKQRNHLLKSKSESAIQSWEQMMAQSASYLVQKRKQVISLLKAPSSQWMKDLSQQQDSIEIDYQPSIPLTFNLETVVQGDKVMQDFELESLPIGVDHSQKVKATPIGSDYDSKDRVNLSPSTAVARFNGQDLILHFQQIWKKMRPKEMHIGSTLVGPHRDDLSIHLAKKSAKTFSSEGQKRSCIYSLRFAEWEQMVKTLGYPPMLGIDDFAIQLDKQRRLQLKNHLKQFNQVFLTSPVALQLDQNSHQIFTIEKGTILV